MSLKKLFPVFALLVVFSMLLSACAAPVQPTTSVEATSVSGATQVPATEVPTNDSPLKDLSGDVVIDGSSTVYPITVAVAEEFATVAPDVRISVGLSGTGGGFKKFCPGEIDISDASRAIKDEEAAICQENGVEFVEFLVALDGLTVMVSQENDWLNEITVDQLAALLGSSSTITKWSDLDPSYPAEDILFFIPDPDSGTRDYMIEIVEKANGDEDLRQDENTTFSSDDNVLLDGIANEKNAFGFFGYAYYVGNKDAVKAVPVVNKAGDAVLPSDTTVQDGTYNPLSRPLYIYVNLNSLQEKPQVAAYVNYYFGPDGGAAIMSEVGYSMPPTGTYEANLALLAESLK
ncbi:MAG: hypothetical protein CVU39_01815 [Chloroflexi bacterium HGW-Chloroflexi-10]|nr:MAG: hypothetical protein CVU39_01815 [Chloroflexi bacterium HGW-Chloroflexi-10]